MKSQSGLSMRMWRQLGPGEAIPTIAGNALPGDWLESYLFAHLPKGCTARLGKPIGDPALEKALGFPIGDQIMIRPSSSGQPPHPLPAATEAPSVETIVCTSPEQARAALKALPEGTAALLLDEGVYCPEGAEELVARLLPGLAVSPMVCAALNASEPVSLPIANEQSPTPRIPGGKSLWETSRAVKGIGLFENGFPKNPGAILVSAEIARQISDGQFPAISSAPCTVPAAVAYREEDKPGVVSSLFCPSPGASSAWPKIAEKVRALVGALHSDEEPIVFYTSAVGSWGGVAVLLRLADELNALGKRAFVAYNHTATPWHWPTRTAPLKVRTAAAMASDWKGLVGHKGGVLVVSNWGAGAAGLEIRRRNPEVKLATVMQDREDWFEDKDGKPVGMKDFWPYFKIGRGASVSQWVIDSLAQDLGITGDFKVLPMGLDTEVFRNLDNRTPYSKSQVRILSMWRPQTDVRRGAALLRRVYEELNGRFGDKISLELFGWNSPLPSGKAPGFAKHHGTLKPRQVAELMAQVDIVVEPSIYQGLGLPGLEAMACGAALASTQCRGVDEYAIHEENALVVPREELAQAVAALILDPALRYKFSRTGPEAARAFDWKNVAGRWAAYLSALS